MWLNICKIASVTWESHGSVFSSKELCTTSGDILTFISLSHSFAGTCNCPEEPERLTSLLWLDSRDSESADVMATVSRGSWMWVMSLTVGWSPQMTSRRLRWSTCRTRACWIWAQTSTVTFRSQRTRPNSKPNSFQRGIMSDMEVCDQFIL